MSQNSKEKDLSESYNKNNEKITENKCKKCTATAAIT